MNTKKALFVLGSLLLLVGLSLVVPARYVGIKKPKQAKLNLNINQDLIALQQDTDNNGSSDWRDMINRQMSTTTKEVAKKTVVDEAAKKRLDDPNNITASFSKNLYTATAYVKDKGELSVAEQDALAASIVDQETAKLTSKSYEVTDLHLVKNETDASRKAYVNSLGTIYKKNNVSKLTVNDIPTMTAFTTNKDASVLQSFVVKKDIIDTIVTQLLAMNIPYSAAAYHLLLVNSLSQYSSMLDNLSKGGDDPLRAALAFKSYTLTIKDIYSALTSMQNYITLEEITFIPSDPGYILVSGGQ